MAESNAAMLTNKHLGEAKASEGRDRDMTVESLDNKLEGMGIGERATPRLENATHADKDEFVASADPSRWSYDYTTNEFAGKVIMVRQKRMVGNKFVQVVVPYTQGLTRHRAGKGSDRMRDYRNALKARREAKRNTPHSQEESCPQPRESLA